MGGGVAEVEEVLGGDGRRGWGVKRYGIRGKNNRWALSTLFLYVGRLRGIGGG